MTTKQLMVGTTSTTQIYNPDTWGNLVVDLTAEVPTGSTVISGGVSVYNVTQDIEAGIVQFIAFAPVSTGWRVSIITSGSHSDDIRVTVYASYVSN